MLVIVYLFIYLLKANSPVNRTESPPGFNKVLKKKEKWSAPEHSMQADDGEAEKKPVYPSWFRHVFERPSCRENLGRLVQE